MTIPVTAVTPDEVATDGGYLFEVTGTFTVGVAHRVHVGPSGDATDPECLSGVVGQGTDVYPLSATTIRCYTPRLSPDTYDVFVRRADDADSGVLADSMTVYDRDFKTSVHEIRRLQPPIYAAGPRRVEDEELEESGPVNLLQAQLEVVGESDNEIGGLHQTRLTAAVEPTTELGAPFTWDGTDTVLTPDTSEVSVGDFVQLDEDGTAFEITAVTPDTSVTVDDSEDTPPTGPTTTALGATYTWDGTLTVATSDTSEVGPGVWIKLDSDGQWFEVDSIVVDTSVTLLNPHGLTVPSGSTASSKALLPTTSLVNRSLPVESVFEWPDAGKVLVGGVLYNYASRTKDPASLDGVIHRIADVDIVGLRKAHRDESVVTDFTRVRSAIELARRAILVEYAEGPYLNALGRNLGVLRYPFLQSDDVFREIIKAIAYNPRGTIYGIELALEAMVGAGNFEVYEDLIDNRCTVFIRLLGDAATSDVSVGKTYLSGPELQLSTSTTTVDIDEDVVTDGSVHSVKLKDEDHTSDFRNQKPSAETLEEYPGDTGTTLWTYTGNDESGEVTQISGESVQIQRDLAPANVAMYDHDARLLPESYAVVNVVTQIDGGTVSSSATEQWAVRIDDGSYQVGWGTKLVDGTHSKIALSSGGYVTGAVEVTLTHGQFYSVEIRKYGIRHVELWVDGALKDRKDYSLFTAAGSSTMIEFGVLSSAGPHQVQGRFKQLGYYARTARDYWGYRDTAAQVATANPTRITASGSPFLSGDVGKRIDLSVGTTRNGQNGLNNGVYEVGTYVDASNVEVVGPTNAGGATVQSANPKRVTVDSRGPQFQFPDDLGKNLVLSASDQGNGGTYVVDKLLDPDTLADLEGFATELPQKTNVCEVVTATFVSESGLDWRLDPNFVTETGLQLDLSDAGSVSGTTLTLRDALPYHPVVVSVVYSQVLSALLLLDFSVKNEIVQELPTVLWAYYPFYLSDPFGFVKRYLDDLTAAGVIPELSLE